MLVAAIKKIAQIVGLSAILLSTTYAAGGISLGGTRLVYSLDSKQSSMPVINSTPNKRFLINSWVESEQGKKIDTILVTPPMFVSEAKSENSLRVVNINTNLPTDRESLYYLNVQAIPSINPDEVQDKNVLQLAILSRIKIFVRPKNLSIRIEEAQKKITAITANQNVYLKNPTPYYLTLVKLKVDNQSKENIMLAPFSELSLNTQGKLVSFETINDYGAFSDRIELSVK